MKDKSPIEQLRDRIALLLIDLLDFIEPLAIVAIVFYMYKLLVF